MAWRLGLDLGTNSIGWAVVNLDDENHPDTLIDMGVRIFSDGRDKKTQEPLAVARRTARGSRVNLHRRKQRRKDLYHNLQSQNLFPQTLEESRSLKNLNPYELRIKALDEKLQPYELGRVLFHLGVRRGFKSNRKESLDTKETKIDDETKYEINPEKMEQGQKCLHLAKTIADSPYRTLGEFLWKTRDEKIGIRFVPERTVFYPTRALYEKEFEEIQKIQAVFYPNIDWDSIYKDIFSQRPLKSQKRGKCQFMKDKEHTFKALPCSHRYRILQEVYNLTWQDYLGQSHKLNPEQEQKLIDTLNSKKEMTFDQIRKLLKIDGRFNLESEIRSKLNGNVTSVALRNEKNFGSKWDDFSLEEQDNIVEKLITANEDSEVVQMLEQYDLSESQKKSITKTSFSSGTTSLCKEITEKLIFEMEEKHIQFDKALILLGFNHSDDSTEKYDMLPYYGQVLVGSTMGGSFSADEKNAEKRYGKIGNPTVHVALNQTKVVVNELIKKYGKPTQIIVELSRDLKASKDAKAEIKRQQNKNIKENERLNSNIKDMVKTIAYPNRNDRRKYKLWEELGSGSVTRKCLYCGKPISAHDIFTKDIEIEHILPFSKTFLDNESNLTVAHAHCNAKKGEHSPYEAFGHITSGEYAWNDIMSRVQMLKNYRKQGYFAVDALEKFAGSKGFHERQLQDTRYLSKVARRYLTCLTEKDSNVWAIPGGMTKMLRDTWKIDGILKRKITDQEIVRFELKDDDIGKIHKNRYDHRHHALDAVVIALVDRSLLQEISTRNARKQTHRIEFPEMPFSHSDIIEKVKNIVVSFKPDHGIEGKLSKETLLGVIKREETVNIQDLKKDDISCIENIKIREDFEKMIAEKGSLVKAKTELKNMYPNINIVKEEFVNRTAITGLTEKNIDSIIDAKIKKDLQDFMLQHKDESFEKNLIDFSKETGIKKVRCKVFVQKPIRIKPNPKNPLAVMRYLNPEDYFAVIIWQIPPKKKDGKPSYEGQFIRRTDVDKNKKLKEQTPPHPAAKKMCQLHKDDYIEFSQDGIWKKARIAGFSATNNKLDIFPIFAANTLRDWVISTNEMVAEPGWKPQAGHNHMSINVIFGDLKARKITVSPIGKVHRK